MTLRAMRFVSPSFFLLSALGAVLLTGCGSKDNEGADVGQACDSDEKSPCGEDLECTKSGKDGKEVCTWERGAACDVDDDLPAHGCGPDATCAPREDGDYACFGRVVLRGMVTDTSDAAAIEGALVLALNDEGFAVTDVAISDEDGSYELDLPVTRKDDGSPVDDPFTLNASALNYQSFPKGARVALPISADEASEEGDIYVLQTSLTDIGLIPLSEGERWALRGQVEALEDARDVAGVLVVATGPGGTFTGISDQSGQIGRAHV